MTWAQIADDAIAAFELADDGEQVPYAYAYLIRGIARRSGWEDPRITTYLEKLYGFRNPDGGWGLNREFTSPGASLNPADTTYSITLSDHVGPTLIEAYRAGREEVVLADIATLVDLLMTTQFGTFAIGKAIAYARVATNNVSTGNNRDVHNVNASAALFLLQANAAGVTYTGLDKRVVSMTRREVAAYGESTAWWPYRGTLSASDTDHTALQAEAMWTLAYPLGTEAAYAVMSTGVGGAHDDEPAARIAWARLAGLPPSSDRMSGTTTLWLTLGDQYLDTIAAFVGTCTTAQKAQIACWAARAADRAAELP